MVASSQPVISTGQPVIQPPQTVYVQPIHHHPVYENFQSKQSGWLGATQITVGLGCLVFNAVGIGIQADMSFIGHGIWCGLFVSSSKYFNQTVLKRLKRSFKMLPLVLF